MVRTLIGICLFSFIAFPVQAQYDTYGGWVKLKGKKTGFFHTEQIDGRWWLVTPEGHVFISKGVCSVSPARNRHAPAMPPEEWARWAKQTAEQLKGWNFNTISLYGTKGGLPGMPYTAMLNFAASQQPNVWREGHPARAFLVGRSPATLLRAQLRVPCLQSL